MNAHARLVARSIAAIAAVLISSAGLAQQAVPGPIIEPWRFQVGACTHFSQGKGIVDLNLDSLKSAGIGAIRDEVAWSAVEREQGQLEMPEIFDTYVRQAAARRVNVMLILDYGNRFYDDANRPRSPEAIDGFCRYSEFVVRHFGQAVRLYEIWNEWDIPIGLPQRHRAKGTPEDYVKLLKAVYPRIKAVDPNVTVIAGAPTSGAVKRGWLEGIVKLGALDYSDAISIHSYNYSESFPQRGPEACSTWMTSVQQMLRGYSDDKDVPFYVTEMGWPTHVARVGTDPELTASYLARLYLLARTSASFKGLWWYDFQDDGWDPKHNEDNFGLVRPDLTPKPAYYVMADISQLVGRGQYVGRIETPDEHVHCLRFTRGGRDYWTLWSDDDQDRQIVLRTEDPRTPVLVRKLGHDANLVRWGFRDWVGRRSGELIPNRLSIVVGHRPFMLSGDLSAVSIVEAMSRTRQVDENP